MSTPSPHAPVLSAERRTADLGALATDPVDVLVIGLGVTGAGVALDAASRGLRVAAVDAHDLAFGTSRWSSKLVHGGLRYLAQGQLGVARESAVERGILMTRTAPHLSRALPMVMPLGGAITRPQATLAMQGLRAGDVLRRTARTRSDLLPRPRRLSAAQTLRQAPAVTTRGLRGGLLSYDGQLEDDARLVVALARTAAAYGATVLTRTRACELRRDGATLRDELGGEELEVRAKVVINATGVWAAGLVPGLSLTPSRGTHLVVRSESLSDTTVAISAPVPGSVNRFVFTLPQSDGLTYLGLTDEPTEGVPDVPEPEEHEVDFLLETISAVLVRPLTRADVVGRYAGLRPLLTAEGQTSDLSRRHAVLRSETGVLTVVGGKLTTYRRMAQDAVDEAVRTFGLEAGPCRTADLPLVGAAPREDLAGLDPLEAPGRLVRRYGAEAAQVIEDAEQRTGERRADLLAAISDTVPLTRAELLWGVTHEGAVDLSDLLDRRSRVGLVDSDRAAAEAAATWALSAGGR